jgi:hypothetical protein
LRPTNIKRGWRSSVVVLFDDLAALLDGREQRLEGG